MARYDKFLPTYSASQGEVLVTEDLTWQPVVDFFRVDMVRGYYLVTVSLVLSNPDLNDSSMIRILAGGEEVLGNWSLEPKDISDVIPFTTTLPRNISQGPLLLEVQAMKDADTANDYTILESHIILQRVA